ncbi:MAG: type II toxin-antitoxin system VapC family toxin [Luteolibacter sp.]
MELIADTTLLIGLWRGQPWARNFAAKNPGKTLGIPWIVLGEFWHGAMRANHPEEQVRRFLSIGLPIIDPTIVIPSYAKICAALQSQSVYRNIGQNDLWIAATAIALDKPLVTRNQRHFEQIDGLKLQVLTD